MPLLYLLQKMEELKLKQSRKVDQIRDRSDYYKLLDALADHPEFAECTDDKCQKCTAITELGEKLWYATIPKQMTIQDFTPEQYKELSQEMTDKEISEMLGVSAPTLVKWKARHQLQKKRRNIKAIFPEILQMREQGLSIKEISKKTGVGESYLSRILRGQKRGLVYAEHQS